MWRVRFSGNEFCEESVFLTLNFVKSPFFSYWFLWKVRFSNVEFCEKSENGLNFSAGQTPGDISLYIRFNCTCLSKFYTAEVQRSPDVIFVITCTDTGAHLNYCIKCALWLILICKLYIFLNVWSYEIYLCLFKLNLSKNARIKYWK